MEYVKLLRQRDFSFLWLARVVSVAGGNIYSLALTWFVLEVTGSALQTGLVMIFSTVATVLIGPFAGALVDHWDRKKTVVASNLVSAATILCILLLHRAGVLQIWHIYAASLISHGASLFSGPAWTSILPSVVGKDGITMANALFNLTGNVIKLVGRGVGGMIVAALGALTAILVNGFSIILSTLLVLVVPLVRLQTIAHPISFRSLAQDMQEGLKYIRAHRVILSTTFLRMLVNFGTGIFVILAPFFVMKVLNESAEAYGWLQVASGLGGLISALVFSRTLKILKPGKCFVISSLLVGILIGIFGLCRSLFICVVVRFLAGFAGMIMFIPIDSVIQVMVLEEKRGRVLTARSIAVDIVRLIAFGLGGALGDLLGARIGIIASGAVLLTAALVGLFDRALRKASIEEGEWV